MPRKSPHPTKETKRSDFKSDWQGFVDLKLSPEDKDWIDAHFEVAPEDFLDMLQDLLNAGYKVSVSVFGESRAVSVSVTGKHPECPNLGYTLSSYAGTFERALMCTWYKCFTIAKGGVWKNAQILLPGSEDWG